MTIYNHTHIQWQQIMTDPSFFGPDKYGVVIDDAFVVQHTHGPFSLEDAPTSYEGDGVVGKSVDHWDGLDHPKVCLLHISVYIQSMFSVKVSRSH